MAKILTGSTLSYGQVLPDPSKTADGSMFFLTTAYVDPITSPTNPTGVVQNRAPGLHIYSFQQDASATILGDQVGQQWKQVSTLQTYVATTGDTMSGPLIITAPASDGSGIRLMSGSPGIRFTEIDQSINAKEWLLVVDGGAFQLQTRDDGYNSAAVAFSVNRSGVGNLNGQQIWTAGNDGAGSTLDSDLLDGQHGSYYLDSANQSGIVPLARGGTAVTTTIPGGIVYGSSGQLGTSIAGTAGQLLQSGGVGAPTWINASALTAASANQLTTARTIALTGAVSGSASFDGTSNITINTTGASVAWSSISGLPSAQQAFANTPSAGYSVLAGASLFYNFGSTGISSMTPPQFIAGSVSGFDSFATSDIGSYQVGLTVIGLGGSGSRSMQLAANWNFEEGPPNGLRYRVNDDTSNVAAWGSFTTLWDSGNFVPGNYVAKSGDSMTGPLNINGINLIYSTNSINVPGSGTFGSVAASGNIVGGSAITISGAGTFGSVTTSNVSVSGAGFFGGPVIAPSVITQLPGTNGGANLIQAGTANTGYVEFVTANSVRQGYIGFSTSTGAQDSGTIPFVMAQANFSGDVVAYASDARLKKNVTVIQNAMDKIGTLGGYSYDWDMEKTRRLGFTPRNEHEHGLLAQEVQKVLPDAVCAAPFNADYLTVKYERLIALLVAGMNEQQVQINSLISEVEDLKNQR